MRSLLQMLTALANAPRVLWDDLSNLLRARRLQRALHEVQTVLEVQQAHIESLQRVAWFHPDFAVRLAATEQLVAARHRVMQLTLSRSAIRRQLARCGGPA